MSDLVNRVRALNLKPADEAADEIERLTAERDAALLQCAQLRAVVTFHDARIRAALEPAPISVSAAARVLLDALNSPPEASLENFAVFKAMNAAMGGDVLSWRNLKIGLVEIADQIKNGEA